MPAGPLLDREFLEKLERLAIRWQKSFAGIVGGHNASRFSGPGQEFLDHRNFHHGDDLRAVNWRAYMRLEKLFMKMFQTEPRVPVRMLIDSSASMSTYGGMKFDYARKIAGALAYVGLVRLDSVEIRAFSGHLKQRIISSGGRHRFHGVADALSNLEATGATDYKTVVREFIDNYSQRGLLIVFSDFLDDGSSERALQYLADFGHELLLVHIWSDEDRTPPWTGELELRDAETGAEAKLDFDDESRTHYTRAFDEYADRIETVALRSGGRYAGISTSQSLEQVIFGELIRSRGIA